MGEVWIKEAETLKPTGNHNAMSGVGGPRATLHCTVSYPGSFDAMHRVLTSKSSESHLLYDPKTDRLGQYFPLDRAARALARGTLAYSHNRVGSVNIQIEVCEMPRDWTVSDGWNPGPNFRAMLRAIRSWGIADEFIYRPAKSGTDRANVVRPDRLLTSTDGGGKWWGHCHYGQGESHYDPGPVNLERFFGAAPTAPATQEDDMPTAEEVANAVWAKQLAKPGNTSTQSAGGQLANAHIYAYRAVSATKQLEATVAAQAAALALLANGSAVDIEQIKAAIAQAVSGVEVTLAVKTDEVQP